MGYIREKLGKVLGRRPSAIQTAALCMDPDRGNVLLITSRDTGRWIIPKGWPMPGYSLAEAAAQEAWEEAGVRGKLLPKSVGEYRYDKRQDQGFAVPIDTHVFRIDVASLEQNYPEAGQRERRWFSPQKAAELVDEVELKKLLRLLPPLLPR